MVMHCPGYSKEFDPTLMFRRILVPVDFSPESRHAVITACEARARFGSEIHLFVTSDYGSTGGLRGLGVTWGHDEVQDDDRRRLKMFAESICDGMPCLQNHARFGGDVIKGIASAATDCGATMVIMGTHDKHSVMRTRTEKILKSLGIPVLVLQGDCEIQPDRAATSTAEFATR